MIKMKKFILLKVVLPIILYSSILIGLIIGNVNVIFTFISLALIHAIVSTYINGYRHIDSEHFKYKGRVIKYSDIIDQELLNFLASKNISPKYIMNLMRQTCGKTFFKMLVVTLHEERPINSIKFLFPWRKSSEGFTYWLKLHSEYLDTHTEAVKSFEKPFKEFIEKEWTKH